MRLLVALFITFFVLPGSAEEAKWKWSPPYEDDSAVLAKLRALGEGESVWLGNAKVEGLTGGWPKVGWLAKGPFTRAYSLKMPYAPDRKTAFYAGQDHNLPHYNDAWEYHLGSNTWHCLSIPDGGDTANAWRKLPGKLKKEKDETKRKAIKQKIAKWMHKHVKFENGYLQTKINDGPVFAWHTWDGLTYDPRTGKMYWAVLDDQATNERYLRQWCKYTGRDYETEKKKLKSGTGLWSFDPGARKWSRWLGEKPYARMRGMGGFLHYIAQLKKMIWYASSPNVSPHEYSQWSYDAVADSWAEMRPNRGRSIVALSKKAKLSPPSEMQVAYSEKHRKLVAVQKEGTWIYDIDTEVWSRGADGKGNAAHDARTIFDYDSVGDVFLLSDPKSKRLSAYSLSSNSWEVIKSKGAGNFDGGKYKKGKGYYDPEHNVFVLTDQGNVWAYRHRKRM